MKPEFKIAATLLLLAGLSGCGSIGDGSTIESLKIVISPVDTFEQGTLLNSGTDTERFHMYHCFCSNVAALATFTDGTVANFVNRVKFTSSDANVLQVLNFNEGTTFCPLGQTGAGLLIPKGVGTVTITADFAGLKDTLIVDVTDSTVNADSSPASYVLEFPPPATSAAVPVGAFLGLRLSGTLDGRARILNRNVLTWSFDTPDTNVATINTIGVVHGTGPSASSMLARATFGTCSSVSPTVAVNVGDVLPPLLLEREAPDFAADALLAVNSDEFLKVTTQLDFDGDGNSDASQLVSTAVSLSYTDDCTLREFDATVPTTFCRETPASCSASTPTCAASTATLCTSGMTACRTVGAGLVPGDANRILSENDTGGTTRLTATFPGLPGTATTLSAAVPDGAATSLTVTALTGYPSTFPWFGTLDKNGAREDVRVTAASGTTLTVDRGISGTVAAAHASGDSFEQRTYLSTSGTVLPLALTAKEGTLTTVTVDPPGTLPPAGTLQLAAQGTFVDMATVSRQQRVTRLVSFVTGTPSVSWFTSDSTVAVANDATGQVFSTNVCGGRVSVRARASTSTDTTTSTFDSTTTADDTACKNTDPLCDQVELCIATPSTLPLGVTCDTPTTCP